VIRDWIRRLLFVAGRVPRYVAVGERDPQQRVRVTLEGLDAPLDVTRNHVVAAVRPLTVAIAMTLPPATHAGMFQHRPLRLRFAPLRDPGTTLGTVDLRHEDAIVVDGAALQLFRPSGSADRSMPPGARAVFRWHQAWAERRRRRPSSLEMEPADLAAFQVLYVCPRPVVLVTVRHGPAGNMFPMDLVGPTAGPYFLMALRNTSPSVRLMRESRRMALADVPLESAAAAIKLGAHHQQESIDWSALPFATDPSPAHGLPVLRGALRVRDVEVREAREVGSHTLFVTNVIHDERRRDGLQLFHMSGPYHRYLALQGIDPPRPVA